MLPDRVKTYVSVTTVCDEGLLAACDLRLRGFGLDLLAGAGSDGPSPCLCLLAGAGEDVLDDVTEEAVDGPLSGFGPESLSLIFRGGCDMKTRNQIVAEPIFNRCVQFQSF